MNDETRAAGPGSEVIAATAPSVSRSADIPGLTAAQNDIVNDWLTRNAAKRAQPKLPVADPLPGIERAIRNASAGDKANLRAVVCDRAKQPGTFIIHDVLDAAGVQLEHPNAVGALTSALAREGVIRKVTYTKARHSAGAGHAVAVWIGADQ